MFSNTCSDNRDTRNGMALADLGGVRKEISIEVLENVEVGDYVLLHAGFALQKIDIQEAEETLKILKEMVSYGNS